MTYARTATWALIVAGGIGGTRALLGARQAPAVAELFAPGVVSTSLDELNAVFTPDGRELFFSISSPDDGMGTIVSSRLGTTGWSTPVVASFSGQFSDYDPFITTDGKRLFFISNRPKSAATYSSRDYDIYIVERTGSGWSAPRNLGAPINTERPEWYPSVASDGTLYFSAFREGGQGSYDLYRAKPSANGYDTPQNLGAGVNGPGAEIDNFVAPDQRYVIFATAGRPDDLGRGDLYISYQRDGVWGTAEHLPAPINSSAREYTPGVSPDGKFFYWTSKRGFADHPLTRNLGVRELRDSIASIRNGLGNIYRIPINAVVHAP
jgi:Tol biopolymer transport system component